MREYNDYVNVTKQYLKNYNQFRTTIENLKQGIEETKQECVPVAPIASYSDMPRGAASELNSVESNASANMMRMNTIIAMERDIERIEKLLDKLTRSIDSLSAEDKRLIEDVFIKCKTWREVSESRYISEKWAREKTNAVVKDIARMMFGVYAVPQNESFCFCTVG